MVHLRLNEREANPNKHINFMSPLPAPEIPSPYSEEDARQLLRALAAQVRPIMKSHGFAVNSLEEYEHNRVFAGRNWNNGETIELVLRRVDGTFVPIPWLLSTFCHELAHIKHMNHGRDFQKLWAQLRNEVEALQARGYFGDGYWSSGRRVYDSIRVGGQGIEDFELPEYICGGAQTRSRPKSLGQRRRRAPRRVAGPSSHTGAQVEKRRKPGTRVKAKGAFKGEGRALNDDISDEDAKTRGTGFRKQAGSKRAREERALAAERRLKALKGETLKTEEPEPSLDEESVTESDSEYEEAGEKETDEARRQVMRESMEDTDEAVNSPQQFMRDFLLKTKDLKGKTKSTDEKDDKNFKSVFDAIEISDDEVEEVEDGGKSCSIPSTSNPVMPSSPSDTRPTKRPRQQPPPRPTKGSRSESIGIGRIVQEEVAFRKKEALGMTGGGRKLGPAGGVRSEKQRNEPQVEEQPPVMPRDNEIGPAWSCLVCTLDNLPNHLACSACGTPRGESQWPHQ